MNKIKLILASLCFAIIGCSTSDDNDSNANSNGVSASRNSIAQIVDPSEYIYYKVGNGPTVFIVDNLYAETSATGFKLSGRTQLTPSTMDFMMIQGYGIHSPGTYTTSQIHLSGTQGPAYGSNNNTMQFNVTQIGANVGDYIDVSFSGTYYHTVPQSTRTITGFAHVRRDY